MTHSNRPHKSGCRCSDVEPRLKAWLDGELPGSQSSLVSAHVGECAPCREEADDFRAIAATLRRALRVFPAQSAAELAARAHNRARAIARQEHEVVRSLKSVAVAAALLLAVGLAFVLSDPSQPRGSLDQVLELALNDEPLPEEF